MSDPLASACTSCGSVDVLDDAAVCGPCFDRDDDEPGEPRYAPVGAVVYCSYWLERYTVLSHNADGSVTIRWHGRHDNLGLDRFPAGRESTHRTPLDRRDTILSRP